MQSPCMQLIHRLISSLMHAGVVVWCASCGGAGRGNNANWGMYRTGHAQAHAYASTHYHTRLKRLQLQYVDYMHACTTSWFLRTWSYVHTPPDYTDIYCDDSPGGTLQGREWLGGRRCWHDYNNICMHVHCMQKFFLNKAGVLKLLYKFVRTNKKNSSKHKWLKHHSFYTKYPVIKATRNCQMENLLRPHLRPTTCLRWRRRRRRLGFRRPTPHSSPTPAGSEGDRGRQADQAFGMAGGQR
jgi:hypothetical protein